jgi:hypothetical protein
VANVVAHDIFPIDVFGASWVATNGSLDPCREERDGESTIPFILVHPFSQSLLERQSGKGVLNPKSLLLLISELNKRESKEKQKKTCGLVHPILLL